MESAKTCNRELRRQMGSSCRIIWMFPWWLEWSCTIGMEIAELHIHKDAFIAITTEVSFFFKRVNTCVDSTGRKNTSDMHTAAICWGRRRRKCSRHIGTNVIRTRRSCHAPPKLNIWTSTASPACVDTGAAISAWLQQPGCQLRQANTATEIQLPVRWRQKKQSNRRVRTLTISPLSGGNVSTVSSSVVRWAAWPTHSCREMCTAWRVCVLLLSFWTCVRTYWGMHVHTQRVCVWGGGGGGDDAVTGVPHLLSCERVPELALG